jgi:hypothetical protein
MKIWLILIVNLIAFFLIHQFYLAVSSNRIEDRSSYRVIRTTKAFEIRIYNPIAIAIINSKAFKFKEYGKHGIKNLSRFGFTNHDFMNSANSEKLAGLAISQNLREGYSSKAKNLITDNNNLYLAVITFDGFAFESDIKAYAKTMVLGLKKANIQHFGNFQFVGYNSHFQFFGRHNEVIVSINYKK